jgi:tRNA threonylcarbamoyladenosine modification (KEOPS) complex  Pcc1 subunit
MAESPFESELKVSFPDPYHAELVHTAMVVDPELRPGEVQRTMLVEGSDLKVKFEAKKLRMLRAATGAFIDLLGVAVDTLEAFKEDIKR